METKASCRPAVIFDDCRSDPNGSTSCSDLSRTSPPRLRIMLVPKIHSGTPQSIKLHTVLHFSVICFIPVSPGGSTLRSSVDETCSVQMRACAPTVCGEQTVPVCQDLQAAGELGVYNQPASQSVIGLSRSYIGNITWFPDLS